MPTSATSIAVLASVSVFALQAATPPKKDQAKVPAKHAPAAEIGPWNNELLVQRIAPDGAVTKLATFARADVSSMARLKYGRLALACQAFPAGDPEHFNRVAVRFSSDEGRSWSESKPIVVANMNDMLVPPFDPTLIALPDGRVRLYFISFPTVHGVSGNSSVYSAISSDCIHYEFEPGERFSAGGGVVFDCAAALHAGVFHLVVPDNGTPADFMARRRKGEPQPGGNGYHATSTDGLAFTRAADLPLPSTRDRWFGNLLSDGTQLLFFGTGPGPWPMTSADGKQWAKAAAPVRMPGVDPSVIRLRDDSLLVVATRVPAPAKP
jgi:hypothetical protein